MVGPLAEIPDRMGARSEGARRCGCEARRAHRGAPRKRADEATGHCLSSDDKSLEHPGARRRAERRERNGLEHSPAAPHAACQQKHRATHGAVETGGNINEQRGEETRGGKGKREVSNAREPYAHEALHAGHCPSRCKLRVNQRSREALPSDPCAAHARTRARQGKGAGCAARAGACIGRDRNNFPAQTTH